MKRYFTFPFPLYPALLFLLLQAAGCKKGTKCEDNSECEYMEACIDGACTGVDCLDSSDCLIEHFCDLRFYECVDGCTKDEDCNAGYECEDRNCVEYGCRETQLDCEYGQFCDSSSGECYDADGPYCKPCNSHRDCENTGPSPTDYPANYNYCVSATIGGQSFCGVDCMDSDGNSDPSRCPRGYECTEIIGQDFLGNTYTVGYNCFADC